MWFNSFAVAVLTTIFFGFIDTQIELIPVRAGFYQINDKYIKWGRFFVNRYSRKSIYYANIECEIICEWNNNVTMEIVFYEKLGNDYKRSFLEMRYRLCDLVNKDDLIGPTIRATGYSCPSPAGEYRMMNLTLNKVVFPYKMPFEDARVDVTAYKTDTKEVLASGYLYLSFKQKKLKKTKH